MVYDLYELIWYIVKKWVCLWFRVLMLDLSMFSIGIGIYEFDLGVFFLGMFGVDKGICLI